MIVSFYDFDSEKLQSRHGERRRCPFQPFYIVEGLQVNRKIKKCNESRKNNTDMI